MSKGHYTAETLIGLLKTNWSTIDLPAVKAVICIYRLRDLILSDVRSIHARFGLSPSELDVLATLRALPTPYEATPTELYKTMLRTSGGMAKILRQLEGRGLISRSASNLDGRRKTVRLTAAGHRLIKKALPTIIRAHRDFLSDGLSNEEMSRLVRLMRRLLMSLEN